MQRQKAAAAGNCREGALFISATEYSCVRMSSNREFEEISEPAAKKQRSSSGKDDAVDLGGLMEDEETAKQKLEEAGFQPGNFTEAEFINETGESFWMTPMIHFCYSGDLRMCRFLLSKGASTTETCDDDDWFPLIAAAIGGRIDVVKWLCENGAKGDIKKVDTDEERTTLSWVVDRTTNIEEEDRKTVIKWLILNGALEERPGEISDDLLRRDLDDVANCGWILYWAEEAVNTHRCFQVFLMGTLLPEFSVSRLRQLLASKLNSDDVATTFIGDISREKLEWYWQKLVLSSNAELNGKPGVLELIANFVGVVRGRELRLKRQLAGKMQSWFLALSRPCTINR